MMDNTIKELQERMKKMEERLDCIYVHVLGEEATPVKQPPHNNGFFIPEVGEEFYVKLEDGDVITDNCNYEPPLYVFMGMIFRTEEQAEAFNREKHLERMEAWQLLNSYSDGFVAGEENFVFEINVYEGIIIKCYLGSDGGSPAYFRTTDKAQEVLDHLGEETIRKAYGR